MRVEHWHESSISSPRRKWRPKGCKGGRYAPAAPTTRPRQLFPPRWGGFFLVAACLSSVRRGAQNGVISKKSVQSLASRRVRRPFGFGACVVDFARSRFRPLVSGADRPRESSDRHRAMNSARARHSGRSAIGETGVGPTAGKGQGFLGSEEAVAAACGERDLALCGRARSNRQEPPRRSPPASVSARTARPEPGLSHQPVGTRTLV